MFIKEQIEKCVEAIDYLINFDFSSDYEFEQEAAMERSYEIIGGLLKRIVKKGLIEQTELVTNAILMRDKISHFYGGLDMHIVKETLDDLLTLKVMLEKVLEDE